ncbi:MAG TPA: alpha/beta fold hydrolase [Pyrinomonadaceae bacterium]|jgi:pimeloyl-ACP methyl ester carboxylesterase|nr:alpha/beta fold hydrolase [Pyrinomonadaceae bacterium]
MPLPRFYEFGPFRVDTAERVLLRDGAAVPLAQKSFDVLLALVERSGRLIDKGELMRKVWPDQFVDEGNLTQHIYTLRRVLGGTEGGQQYIETVPRRGYRFSRHVEAKLGAPPSGDGEHPAAEAVSEAERDAAPKPVTHPETNYTRSGDVNIAYQVIGDGPLDLVFVMGWVSHLEYFWKDESFSAFLRRLASFSRLILFDKRGTGLSDRVPLNELPTLEQRMDDVRCVMEAAGSERAALVGVSEGGPMSALFAATYPERTAALVMIGTYAKRLWAPDYPWAPTPAQREHFIEEMRQHWGGPVGLEERAPSKAGDPLFREWWATYLRMGASPGAAIALTKMNAEVDVRDVLPTVRVPTLVLHRTGDRCLKVEEGRYVAGLIPGASYVELPGEDHLPFVGDQGAILDEIEEFLTGVRHKPEPERVLATVLSVRIADSPGLTPEQEPDRWLDLLHRFRAQVSREVARSRGREIDMTGAGPLAIFDGPARAIRCACAISEYASRLGIEVRAGLHTGECDLLDENRVGGLALEIGMEISERAGPGEVLVSHTVRDLVAGSGLLFEERGTEVFDAFPGRWRLHKVARQSEAPAVVLQKIF